VSQSLIILGTGGSAYDVLDIVEAINAVTPTWHVAGFLDDAAEPGKRHLGYEVLGTLRDAHRHADSLFINVIGSDRNHRKRPEILATTGRPANCFATLVHPKATVSSRARVGKGVYVAAGASIAGGVEVQDHASVSPGVIVGHDSVLGTYAMFAPGSVVSGFVQVGQSAYVGAGAVVRQRVRIGKNALVGMGAVVLRDVEEETTVVGNPARILADRSSR
jgi:sugar O-acyltransferase (sialic acid O-acetyltransferase NeuD family)